MRENIHTRRRNRCLHGQIIQTPTLEKWEVHVDLSQHDMVTGSARGE
jgi:hypothetical protein